MNEDVVAVFIPIVAIVMSLGIPIIYQILDYRRRRDVVEAHHKERMAAIERGMELPPLPEAFYGPLDRNKRPRHLLTGMVWLFIGIALFLALGAVAGEDVRFFAPDSRRGWPRVPDLLLHRRQARGCRFQSQGSRPRRGRPKGLSDRTPWRSPFRDGLRFSITGRCCAAPDSAGPRDAKMPAASIPL